MIRKTKFYVVVDKQSIDDKSVYYFFNFRGFWVDSLIKIGEYNYIVGIEYEDENEVNKLIGDHRSRAINFQVRRIFKSTKIIKAHREEPNRSFLNELIILASARIKDTTIKIISKTEGSKIWKDALLNVWQEEIDHPKKFKELGIVPQMDIAPDGNLRFHMNKIGNYIVTYFDTDISKYYTSIKKENQKSMLT